MSTLPGTSRKFAHPNLGAQSVVLYCPILSWNASLVSPLFLKRSLVFPILLFSSISLLDHWERLTYLSLLFFGTLHPEGYIFPFLPCLLLLFSYTFSSVQFGHSVNSDSLWPRESQHTKPPCPSPSPGVHLDSHPSSQWCHPAISSSVILFTSCPQSLPASESFPMSQLFAWGGQNTGVAALASFLPKKSQGWSPSE